MKIGWLVATLPLYLNSLAGRGVHLVTPNDYLSKVGLQLMGPIYNLLGVSAAAKWREDVELLELAGSPFDEARMLAASWSNSGTAEDGSTRMSMIQA